MLNKMFWRPANSVQLFVWLFVLIVIIAAAIRLTSLGAIPHGMTWDEAAIGYNGHAVITTRRDEWLVKLPVSFQSFGDYKAPAAIYINGLFTVLLGMNLFAVRLPFALAGIAAVAAFGWIVNQLSENRDKRWLSLLGALLIATVPWHVHYSRIGFESGIALSMFLIGLGSFLFVIKNFSTLKFVARSLLLGLVTVCWVSSLYTYHSAKIFLPLFIVWLAWIERNWLKKYWRWTAAYLMIGVGLLIPLVRDSIWGPGATRAGVLIIGRGFSIFESTSLFFSNLIAHFNPNFLVFGKTESYRHGSGLWGVLSPVSFSLLILGVVGFLAQIKKRQKISKLLLFGFVITLLGLLPAALSAESVPHSNRALFALPGMLLIATAGTGWMISLLSQKLTKEVAFRTVVGMVVLLEILCFFAYWQDYTTRFNQISADDFQDGYLEAMTYAFKYEKGIDNYPQVDKIIVTDRYGQPYIFALFVRQTSPIAYRGGSLYKYEFNSKISNSDLMRNNALIISSPTDDIPAEGAEHLVYGSDGQLRFIINYTGSDEK